MSHPRKAGTVLCLFLLVVSPFPASGEGSAVVFDWGEEFTFDVSEFEKSPFESGGFWQFDVTRSGFRTDSSLYRLTFPDRDRDDRQTSFGISFQPGLTWQEGPFRVFFLSNLAWNVAEGDWTDEFTLLEGSASWRASSRVSLSAGKILARWGKGYAFSPVNFVGRDKTPSDPDLALEGFWMALADVVFSYPGPLKTVAFTGVALPVDDRINRDFGRGEDMNWAGRLYLLWHDTDIDVMMLSKGSRTARFGVDFSRNLASNFEVHGEWARVEDFVKQVVAPDYSRSPETYSADSFLFGVRYLTTTETTFIVEYYRNGQGYTKKEARDFFALVENSGDEQLDLLREISRPYQKPNFMRNYLYCRISQKEPFGWLYVTPGVTSILNLDDGSFNVIPEVVYTRITNLEIRCRVNLLSGDEGTEYGEKPNRWKAEGRVRYFF